LRSSPALGPGAGVLTNTEFILGTSLVMLSTYLYSGPDRKRGRPPPINIINYEKTTIDATPKYVDETKLNLDPLDSIKAVGLSTSRPSSPGFSHARASSARGKHRDE